MAAFSVPKVITMEEEFVLNPQKSSFLRYLADEIIKQTKIIFHFHIRSLLALFHLVLPVYTGTKRNVPKGNYSFSGAKTAPIAFPTGTVATCERTAHLY